MTEDRPSSGVVAFPGAMQPERGHESPKEPLRILCIEPDDALAVQAKEYLESKGHRITRLKTVEEALKIPGIGTGDPRQGQEAPFDAIMCPLIINSCQPFDEFDIARTPENNLVNNFHGIPVVMTCTQPQAITGSTLFRIWNQYGSVAVLDRGRFFPPEALTALENTLAKVVADSRIKESVCNAPSNVVNVFTSRKTLSPSILLIEPDEGLRTQLKGALERQGYRVSMADRLNMEDLDGRIYNLLIYGEATRSGDAAPPEQREQLMGPCRRIPMVALTDDPEFQKAVCRLHPRHSASALGLERDATRGAFEGWFPLTFINSVMTCVGTLLEQRKNQDRAL